LLLLLLLLAWLLGHGAHHVEEDLVVIAAEDCKCVQYKCLQRFATSMSTDRQTSVSPKAIIVVVNPN